MRLTSQTDFGLRIMMFAAARGSERFTVNQVADAFAISRNHTMKIVQKLAASGLLVSVRGRGGGLVASATARQTRLGDIVRLLEEEIAPAACFTPDGGCCILGLCKLRGALGAAVDSFFATLDRQTLGDIALSQSEAARLLAAGSAPGLRQTAAPTG
jgi:Rrf2 family nitric oxide-sensitive transcriptional repressor